jgi:hypothetical protein
MGAGSWEQGAGSWEREPPSSRLPPTLGLRRDERAVGFFLRYFSKENAPRQFARRLLRCQRIFTKPPTPLNRYETLKLSKAFTTIPSVKIRKRAKQCGV